MKISRNSVVALEYSLKNDAGEVLDESGGDPLVYLHGRKQLVPGLERALDGQVKGAQLNVVVKPKDGYGEKGKSEPIKVPMDQFPEDDKPEVGMAIEAVGPDNQATVLWVVGQDDEGFTLSLDHPLAGVTLHFDITIHDVRAATKEELSHGHVHGPDGHHHH